MKMAYCVLADVEGYTGRTYTANSFPTADQVDELIDNRAAELDAIIRKHGITVASLGAGALSLLLIINAKAAGCDAEKHSYRDSDAMPDAVKSLCDYVRDWLEKLDENPSYLDDSAGGANPFRSRFTTGVTASDASSTPTPGKQNAEFRKGDEW